MLEVQARQLWRVARGDTSRYHAFKNPLGMAAVRTRYLISYDISDARRLRRVAKVLEGYSTRLQYLFIECPLDEVRLTQAKSALAEIINTDHD